MAEKMSFLTIPDRKGLFKNEGSPIRAQCDEGQSNSDEEYEESEETNMRLIPRCSPIPRKRGQSIYDETEEYMKIKDAIPSRRVSFADTLGGDLAHVKEFEQFYSDEEGDARLEEEEAKYRPKTSEPTYRLSPEWTMPTTITLTKAVHTNKVEVESVSTIEGEPLAFTVIIRVLNISFIKTVCVRSTMDNWKTYFDCPAEYLQGDGETDKFSFKLSFCPPYLYHGARIEFVVRYETPDGDYWANNSQMNYAVTLIVSYEDNVAQAKTSDMPYRRSILKTESSYRMDDSDYFEQFTEKNEDEAATKTLAEMKPTHVCPDVLQPELDLEELSVKYGNCTGRKLQTAEDSHSSLPANLDLLSADGSLPCTTVSLGKQSPIVSSTSTTNALISRPVATQANIMTAKPEPSQELVCDLPIPDCEIPNMDPEQDHLSKDTLEHVRPPPALKSPLHISIDEASETAPTQTIAEGPGGEEEEGGNSREEPKDSTRLWLSPSVPTVEVEHSDEHLGGTSTWNCAQPYPCHMDIEANRSSPEDVLYQNVHLAKLDILRKEEDVMEEVLKQGSKVEEEVLRQEAQIETDEEKQKSFTIQEPITTSSSNLNPPSQPAPCKLGTSEDGRKSQFQTSGTSPPLSEEKQQTTMDDGLSRGGVVLVMEAVGAQLERSQAGGEVFSPSCAWPLPMVTITNCGPTGEDKTTPCLDSQSSASLGDSSLMPLPASHQCVKQEKLGRLSRLSEDLGSPSQQDDISASSHTTTALDSQSPLGVPEDISATSMDVAEMTRTQKHSSNSNDKGYEEEEVSFQFPSETLGSLPNRSSEAQVPMVLPGQAEPTLARTGLLSMVFLAVVVGLVLGLHEPSTFLYMGLLLVLFFGGSFFQNR